jgi:hypothetical protein
VTLIARLVPTVKAITAPTVPIESTQYRGPRFPCLLFRLTVFSNVALNIMAIFLDRFSWPFGDSQSQGRAMQPGQQSLIEIEFQLQFHIRTETDRPCQNKNPRYGCKASECGLRVKWRGVLR